MDIAERDYWPTQDWKESTPEDQGIKSGLFSELRLHIRRHLPHVRSMLVVRCGYLVFEEYFQQPDRHDSQDGLPHSRPMWLNRLLVQHSADRVSNPPSQALDRHDSHAVFSVTKSLISALVGIALEKGYLESVEQRVVDFFPGYVPTITDPRIEKITLKHLLTMTAGFDLNENRVWSWQRSADCMKSALELPMAHEPGQRFNYNGPASHLLSGILSRSTHLSAMEFAEKHLCASLGISALHWSVDLQGHNWGGTGVALKPRDMAKLGYLYLNHGRWHDQQIISTTYVQDSTQEQSSGGFPESTRYGYLWWVTTVQGHSAFFAAGYGGQYIFVVPDLDLVVVITSNSERPHMKNKGLITEFVVPAVIA